MHVHKRELVWPYPSREVLARVHPYLILILVNKGKNFFLSNVILILDRLTITSISGPTCLCNRALLDGPTYPVVWIDNFSKNLARHIPRVSKGVFTSMMWTGLAVKLYDGPELPRSLVMVDGDILSAMPLAHAPDQRGFQSAAEAALPFPPHLVPSRFLCSMVHRYKVRAVPPKVDVGREKKPSRRLRLQKSRDGLHRFLPWELWRHNIGSNDGLIDVIQQYTVDTRLQESTQYHVWLVDLNIYTRVYKVWSLVVRLCVLV